MIRLLAVGEKSDDIPINIGINYLNLSTIYGGGNYTIKQYIGSIFYFIVMCEGVTIQV